MAGTAMKIIIFIASLVIGVGVTLFYDSILPGSDQLTLIGIGLVMTLAAYISFYFMSKSNR
jgi:hypothetical protein